MNQHDVINNTLRIEVLGKILIESLENEREFSLDHKNDYVQFLKDQINYLESAE